MADNFEKDILFQALQEQEMPERVFGKKKGFPYIFESGTSSAFGPYQIQYGLMEDVRDNLGSLKKQAGINVPDGFNSYLIKLIRDSKNKFNASNNLEYNGKVPSKKIFGPLKEGTIKKELHEKYYPILAELALESKKNILANKNKPISLENISKAWHGNTIAKKNDEYASIIKDNYTSIQRSTALDKEDADDVYKIGEDTGTKTIVGKPVFKTPQGENVSERSVTFKVGGKYINAPSIQDGVEYSEDEIRDKYIRGELKSTSEHGNIEDALTAARTRSDTLLPEPKFDKRTQDLIDASAFSDTEINMNEGGMAKSIDEQMELFAEGGLYEEGGMLDDESGNEVPPGSLKEEVRDDIPANLSEGEFVFPADVVRYWGLDTLMRMRQKAKAGLRRMEAMGQMGNADEATMPDDLPFDINDLELEDEQEELNFQTGGLATNPLTQNALGNFMGSAGTDPNQMYGPMSTPLGYPSTQQTPEASATAPMEAASARYMQPSQYAYQTPSFTYTPEKEVMPTFRETTGMGVPGIDYETLTYVNDAGDTIIMYKDKKTGKLYNDMFQEASVPEGYKLKTEVKPEEVTTKTAKVVDTDSGRDQNEEDQEKMKTDRARVDAAKKMGYKNFAGVIEGITAAFGFGTLPEGTVTGIGYVSDGKGQLFDPLTGRPIPSNIQGALKKSWGQITDAIKGKDRLTQDLITKGVEQSTKFGKDFYRQAGIVKVDRIFDDIKNNIREGGALDKLGEDYIDDVRNSVKEEAKKGNFYTETGLIANPFEAGKNRGTGSDDSTPPTPDPSPAPAPAPAPAPVQDNYNYGDHDSNDNSNDGPGGGSSSGSSGPGNASSGSSCFAAGTKFFMEDGSLKNIEDIKIGDVLQRGGKVRTTIVGDGLYENWYLYGNTKVTGTHTVFEKGKWKRVANSDKAIPTDKDEFIYTLVNEKHRLIAEDGVMYGDYDEVDNLDIEDGLLEMMNLQDAVEEAA